MRSWILAMRPKTLTAAFVPILAATALVHFEQNRFSWSLSLFALLAAVFIQIATNFF